MKSLHSYLSIFVCIRNQQLCRRFFCHRTVSRLLGSIAVFCVLATLMLSSPPLMSTYMASASQPQSPYPKQVKVVLLAYFRSGSTLVSQLFNYNPMALYWFEPLYAVTVPWKWYWPKGILPRNHFYFDNGSEIEMNDIQKHTLTVPLQHIFRCELDKLDRRITASNFMRMTKLTGSYRDCRNGAFVGYKPGLDAAGPGFDHVTVANESDPSSGCLRRLIDSCRYSQLNVVKLIRLKMSLAEELLQSDPDVKIVHLVRDPRGILNSWWHQYKLTFQILVSAHNISKVTTPQQWDIDAKLLCLQLKNDVVEGRRLAEKYQGRVKVVKYEDMAADPLNSTEALYRFLFDETAAVDVPDEVWRAIKEMVDAKVQDGVYGTKRKDSVKTSKQWRNSMNSTVLSDVTEICRPVLELLNYEI